MLSDETKQEVAKLSEAARNELEEKKKLAEKQLADEKKKYEEIMSRLDKYKSKGQESKEGITPRDGDRVEIDSREAAYRSRISNTSNGIRP